MGSDLHLAEWAYWWTLTSREKRARAIEGLDIKAALSKAAFGDLPDTVRALLAALPVPKGDDNKTSNTDALSRAIGERIGAAAILCPNCEQREQIEQPLMTIGDDESHVFCPHCDLECTITVRLNRRERT